MSVVNMFNSWDEVASYVENTLGIHYTDNPTGWVEAMKELDKGYKYVNIVNEVTGEVTTQRVPESLISGVGEWHIGENTSGVSGVSTGGAKSVPTAKSVVTNSQTQTAVITDEAVGVKDTGILQWSKGMGIISGLLQIYGLVHAGIQIANAQVWKDMSNYVFDSDFTEDTPVERVIEFMKNKLVNTVTELSSDGELITNIPESIARRMYTFLANHMILEQTPGIEPDLPFDVVYNFVNRTFDLSDSSLTLERYISTTNPTTTCSIAVEVQPSDDFIKYCVSDFFQQVIGSGFLISNQTSALILDSINGSYSFIKDATSDDVEVANVCQVRCELYRGTGVSKDTPISANEIMIYVDFIINDRMVLHDDTHGNKFYIANLNTYPSDLPTLATGSYVNGDCVKYLKRGKTGTETNDYAYYVSIADRDDTQTRRLNWSMLIYWSANERRWSYLGRTTSYQFNFYINGFPARYRSELAPYYVDDRQSVPDEGMSRGYSNLALKGHAQSYTPDDYLVYAGIRSKNDDSGYPEKHPDPTKTMEEQYPETATKKQQANPQKDQQGNVTNNITNYVTTTVPFGSENTDRLIKYGMNNDNPNSYQDNRSQEDKLKGKVNTNDPIDGFNEDTNEAVDEYNKSRNDPNHYPDPIPQNEPNPQYPTTPPTNTEGDSGDTPTTPQIGGVTASGMVSVYNPTKQQLIDFSAWLWSPSFLDNFLKIFANPMDAIIGLHIMYATPISSGSEHIIAGYLDSNVSSKVVTQQYSKLDCGTITIPEYYGNATDYEPYTSIHIYLPFIGIVPLKANDVLGKKLHLEYGIDALTGTCLATLTSKQGDSEITCYTFAGNCAVQIPVSGGNYAQMITGLAGFIVAGAGAIATANPILALGAGASFMSGNVNVQHSGSIGSNAGACGIRKPYVIITRKKAYDAQNYQHYYGFPANLHTKLLDCKGYTQVKSCHIESIYRATDNEKQEIESLLKQGVIIV